MFLDFSSFREAPNISPLCNSLMQRKIKENFLDKGKLYPISVLKKTDLGFVHVRKVNILTRCDMKGKFFVSRSCLVDQFTFHISLLSTKIHNLYSLITTHDDDFDSADPSSMQDACHI